MLVEIFNWTDALWKTLISLKFGNEAGGWFAEEIRGSFGISPWKEIIKDIF